jgi:hypothetical protein
MDFQNLKQIFECSMCFVNISDNRYYDLSEILWDQDKEGYLFTISYRNSHLDDNIQQIIQQINYDGPPIHAVVGTNYIEAQYLNHRFSINNTLGFTTLTLIFKFSGNDESIIKKLFGLYHMLYQAENILLPLDINLNDFFKSQVLLSSSCEVNEKDEEVVEDEEEKEEVEKEEVEEEEEDVDDYYPEGALPPWYKEPKITERMKELKKSDCFGTSFFKHPNSFFTNMIEDNHLEECAVCTSIWTKVSYH